MNTPSDDPRDVTTGAPDASDAVAFFDIGDTLAAVRVAPGGEAIESLTPLPGVLDALETLQRAGVRMGVVSDRGRVSEEEVDAALERAGLAAFLDPALVLYGRKDSTRVFDQAAAVARSTVGGRLRRLLFVGEDATERSFAAAAGFRVCPYVTLAPRVLLAGSPLRYVRITVPQGTTGWQDQLRHHPVVPLHLTGRSTPQLYAVTDTGTALVLDDLGFRVDRLGGDEPATSDLHLLRDDGRDPGSPGEGAGSVTELFGQERDDGLVLSSTDEGLVVALPAGRSVEHLHLGRPRHGHNLKLTAQPFLLADTGDRPAAESAAAPAGPELADARLSPQESDIVVGVVTPERIQEQVERYSGAGPLTDGTALVSRHVLHPDNQLAVTGLVTDLTALGGGRLTVRTHRFSHAGRSYRNVEATLPARGMSGTVLVTAHLDSTASRDPGFRPEVDAAPGADDDASGISAVLAATRAVLALDEQVEVPHREFRFVLFNAEEQGLVGSRAYARDQAVAGAPIEGVFQIDMVGFDAQAPQTFELHAGFGPSATVEARSLRLTGLVAAVASQVSPDLPPPQVYPGPDGVPDPAEQRSDHHSFQLNGYPACLASEDFFAGPGAGSPPADPNPHYHSAADRTVDTAYTGAITRAMTAAAWICGTR
ncbi:MAG TPA: M28 family peptidase [Geodermatophilus sp.]|nr:M28 family peptidase [Geodermatophilus sp.]